MTTASASKLRLGLLLIIAVFSIVISSLLLRHVGAGGDRKLTLDKRGSWEASRYSSSVRETQTSNARTRLDNLSRESTSDMKPHPNNNVFMLRPNQTADDVTYRERSHHLREACHQLRTSVRGSGNTSAETAPLGVPAKGVSQHFFVSTIHKLVYCSVQKVGSSFWKRAFRVLNSVEPSRSLFRQSGMAAHLHNENITLENKSTRWKLKQLNQSLTFLFVRDPFARTFSGYVDKIFLPFASGLVRIDNQTDFDKDSHLEVGTDNRTQCRLEVPTFAEFIRSQLSREMSLFTFEPHFSPIHKHCSPCKVSFDIVGKMESFRQDVEYILGKVGVRLSDLADDLTTFDARSDLSIMTDITRRTLFSPAWRKTDDPNCRLARHELLTRMWTVFQIRGLLSASVRYPLSVDQSVVATIPDILLAVKNGYEASGDRPRRLQQREAAMREAFSSLPVEDLKKLQERLKVDCTLFDYDCSLGRLGQAANSSVLDNFAFFKNSQ